MKSDDPVLDQKKNLNLKLVIKKSGLADVLISDHFLCNASAPNLALSLPVATRAQICLREKLVISLLRPASFFETEFNEQLTRRERIKNKNEIRN